MKKTNINNYKNNIEESFIFARGITLVSLVITIILLIILASVVINLSINENGIISRAREAKKLQILSEIKEKIGTEILTAEIEAIERNEELEQKQLEDIISKYGKLQEDGDTLILNDNKYEIKLSEIYSNATKETGSYTENVAKIELLEKQIKILEKELENNNVVYQVSSSIYGSATSPNGIIVMPNIKTSIAINGGRAGATVLSNKVMLLPNQSLRLPKGIYTFESFVPVRGATWGAGYKVFDKDGKQLIDHTYTGATQDLETTNFELEETTDITIYWYRKSSGWIDLTYYTIKTASKENNNL